MTFIDSICLTKICCDISISGKGKWLRILYDVRCKESGSGYCTMLGGKESGSGYCTMLGGRKVAQDIVRC
jgi:hypothetical protein